MMPSHQPNVIVLTSGISGSSVLTGLISRAGYWTGDDTFKKEYDTHENQELIRLDKRLIDDAHYAGNYAFEFSAEAIGRIAALANNIDTRSFREFLQTCERHRPWIWKDPRLWLTIRFWSKLMDLNDCRLILLTRSYPHSWVSSILRRHIRSYGSNKRYEQSIRQSIIEFLKKNDLPFIHVTFENLIVHPEETIRELNAHIGTELTVEDLAAIYNKPLYKAPRSSVLDFIKAILMYVKNYSERIDLQEKKG